MKTTLITAVLLLGAFTGGAHAAQLKAAPGKPPVDIGRLAAPQQDGATEDYYCKDGHKTFASCSPAFVAACKKVGGTMSGEQGWGGRTCFTPS